jgi:hypothetical protein
MTLIVRPGFQFDADASTYIEAVEVADAQALETATRYAINDFVIGCKQDGIWSAIKASCILAGARTLAGALIPLAGTAPTNLGPFVSGDYNRKTGLVGDGSTKYLDSNRANNADPQDSNHNAFFCTVLPTTGRVMNSGIGSTPTGANTIAKGAGSNWTVRSRNGTAFADQSTAIANSFVGISRSSSASYQLRANKGITVLTQSSQAPTSDTISIFRGATAYADARLAFYSIGESLNLAALDARVTALITAFGVAIP